MILSFVQRYVVTWDFQNPCSKFKQDEAKAYCQSMNMEPVSLDSPAKQVNKREREKGKER